MRSFFAWHHLADEFAGLDLGDDEQIPDSVGFLADKVGRLSVGVEHTEDLIAGEFGDRDGMSSEEGEALLAIVPHLLELLDDMKRHVHLLAWRIH